MKKRIHREKTDDIQKRENVIHINAVVDLDDAVESVDNQKHIELKKQTKIIGGVALLVFVILIVAFFIYDRTTIYSEISTVEVYPVMGVASSQFEDFSNGIVKYGRDGVVFLDYQGEEIWNQGYQITSPVLDKTDKSIAIADRGGNNIYVFDEEGFKGQIETNLPIEKFSVSEQGVVAVLVKGNESAKIICYDAVGNILVEHSVSSSGMGYPIDVEISQNGKMLLVTYLQVVEGEIVGRVAYYNFEKSGTQISDYLVAMEERVDVVMPTTYFINNKTSIVVTNQSFMVFEGGNKPTLSIEVEIDGEIKSVACDGERLAFVLMGETTKENELRVYDIAGNVITSHFFEGQYSNMKLQGNQVLMYDGNQCKIFTMYGKEKFNGEFEEVILNITKKMGINEYIVVDDQGMNKVRLRK